ncbi:MAG: transcriptional regulator [Candidatus Bathyarchaeia archaeon]
MTLPCEIAVKCLLPPVRAMIAKILVSKYNLRQTEAAKRLGVSQPAISLYEKKMRGRAISFESSPEIMELIENLARSIARGGFSRREFFQRFCEICRVARAKGLLCQLHKSLDPKIADEGCELCIDVEASRCF